MSDIRANTISDAAGTGPITLTKQSAAKAWAKVVQASATLYDTFNVSSYTDLGVGMGQHNFSSNMQGTGYSSVGSAYGGVNTSLGIVEFYSNSQTGGIPFYSAVSTPTNMTIADGQVAVIVMGDLA